MLTKVSSIPSAQSASMLEPMRPTRSKFSAPVFQAGQATMQSTRRNTHQGPRLFNCGTGSATAGARAIDRRPEFLLVERVAADAEIGIGLAAWRACPRTREEVLDAPAVGEPHALGMTCRNRF